MSWDDLDRLIANARTARNAVEGVWGKNYWDNVLAHLLRKAGRYNINY